MVSEMYKSREKLGWVFLVFVILLIVSWALLKSPQTTGEWMEMLYFLLPIGFVISYILINRSRHNKVKDFQVQYSGHQLLDLNHVIIKKDASLLPKLLLFDKDGSFIGMVKPVNVSWWKYPFLLPRDAAIEFFPLSYAFVSHDGNTLMTFRKTGWLRQVKLSIFNEENRKIGSYAQKKWKDFIHFKGQIFNEKEETILSIKASGFSGSFSWKDSNGRQWAYFYNGKFPHEYTHLFRDSQNDIVELSDTLSIQDKTRVLAVIGYFFINRIK